MRRREDLLSYSALLARPGVLPVFAIGIGLWIFLMGGMMGIVGMARAGLPAFAAVSVLMILPAIIGPLFGATPVTIVIGSDGIETRWLGRRRFISFRDVIAIERVRESIEVRIAHGDSLWLRPVRRDDRRRLVAMDAVSSELLRELRAAYERASRLSGGYAEEEARWAKGDRKTERWVAEVVGERTTSDDYRERALDRERLLSIAERSVAEPTARAAAATVLARLRLEPPERERIRVVAEQTAHPKLRAVLEAAADESSEEAELVRRLQAAGEG